MATENIPNNSMQPLLSEIWKLVKLGVNSEVDMGISFHEERFNVFASCFEKNYKNILNHYMSSDVKALDRHKVTAILIISLIETEPLEIANLPPNKIFLGNENLALQIGLSYMQHELNDVMQEKGIKRKIAQYNMPMPISCNTSYIDVMGRNLYFSKSVDEWGDEWGLNPLELAERLFLIEYITLMCEGINPYELRDNKTD